MGKTYIGIDMGTSGVKLILMDEKRALLGQACLEYELSRPHEGWSEIDPAIWYEKTVEGLKRLLRGQDASSVSAIGVTGQMHSLILLDEAGESLRPAMLWNDKRTADLIPALQEALREDPDGSYLCGIVSTGSPAANLYWFSLNEPERFARCHSFLIGPDYLVYRLTGVQSTDFVEASTSSLYCLSRRAWSEPMRRLIGLKDSAWPTVRGSAEVVGTVLPALAAQLGLRDDVKVIAGIGDNPATAVSTGCLGQDYPVLSLGTSGVLMFPVKAMEDAPLGKRILCSMDGKRFAYLVQGVVQSTGEAVSWWTRRVLGVRDFGTLDSGIDAALKRRSRVLFYPHINGDKTLYADPTLRGAFIGLSSETGPEALYYAVIEGLCFAFRQLAEGMGLDLRRHGVLKVVGGGAKSDLWLHTLADVLNVRVERLGGNIGPGFGAALLACSADHPDMSLEALTAANLQIERAFEPDRSLAEALEGKYLRYLRIHDALKYIDDGRL